VNPASRQARSPWFPSDRRCADLVLIGNKWAFAHIPKCGGMAVRSVLTGIEQGDLLPLGKKAPIKSPLHRIPICRPFVGCKSFTVIRHPAAWIKSFWADQTPERMGGERYLHRFWSDDLNEFAERLCAHNPGYVGKLYTAYTKRFQMAVFRLEDGLENAILKATGIHVVVPLANASTQAVRFDPVVLKQIAHAERACLRRYRYK